MIIAKAKHEKIVSLKDADIKLHENKIKGLSKSLYKKIDELENVREDLKLANTEISMKNDSINELKKEVEQANNRVEYMIECKNDDESHISYLQNSINYAYHEIEKLNKEKARTEEIKRQYREYINKALEITHIEHYATTKDIEKFMSKEGARGIIDLYTLASLM